MSDDVGPGDRRRANVAVKTPNGYGAYARRSGRNGGVELRLVTPDEHSRAAGYGRRLKLVLRALDLFGLTVGWWLAYRTLVAVNAAYPQNRLPLTALAVAGIGTALVVMASKRLWLARVCVVRSAELAALGQTAVLSAMSVLTVGQLVDYDAPDRFALFGAFYSFVLLVLMRSMYAASLRSARRRGRLARPLVLVGANAQARELTQLIRQHPEMGYDIVGVCGPRGRAIGDLDLPWLGEYDEAAEAVERTDATGALVIASALDHRRLNRTLRQLLRTGCHIHLSSSISGISHERLLPLPLAREPLYYLEQTSLTRSQRALKRIMDVVVAATVVLVSAPVMFVAAAAVKISDGGSVIFRQLRVGQDGQPFTLYKFRTMVVDAEARRAELDEQNHRSGPLFKMARDPRITSVGRVLRATSIDELPQLFNVLRGDMSLVGPRPALPEEVEQFDDEHQQRVTVMPGITGLWQVEGRDDPSFDSYRRLDVFYVENWSIGLDVAILMATAGVVASRSIRSLSSDGAPL